MAEPAAAVALSPRQVTTIRARTGSARAALGTLAPGCRVAGLTKGTFSLIDLIEATCEQIGQASVSVATWTPGPESLERVLHLRERHLISAFRLVLDRSYPGRHPAYVARLASIVGQDALRMTRIHAKFATLRAGDFRIVIRGSMNFNTNPRLEQFDLDDDPTIFDLYEGLVADLWRLTPPGLDAPEAAVHQGFLASLVADAGEPQERGPAQDLGALLASVGQPFELSGG